MSDQLLNFPVSQARFATVSEMASLEPEETDKDTGFAIDQHVPSQWLNWLLKMNHEWNQRNALNVIGQWRVYQETAAETCIAIGIIYHPGASHKAWYGIYAGTIDKAIRSTTSEFNLAVNNFTGDAFVSMARRRMVYDSSYIYTPDFESGDHQLMRSSDGVAWTKINIRNVGIYALCTKRPRVYSTYILAGFSDSKVYYATVATGTWVEATTHPSGGTVKDIIYVSGNVFALIMGDGSVWNSIDNGVNWIETENTPESESLIDTGISLDCNFSTGVMVAVGTLSGNGVIVRSPNLGNDWESVTTNLGGRVLNAVIPNRVKYVGGDCWVMCCGAFTVPRNYPGILVSVDDGKTWELPSYNIEFGDSFVECEIVDFACNGRQLIALADDGYIFVSNALAGAEQNVT